MQAPWTHTQEYVRARHSDVDDISIRMMVRPGSIFYAGTHAPVWQKKSGCAITSGFQYENNQVFPACVPICSVILTSPDRGRLLQTAHDLLSDLSGDLTFAAPERLHFRTEGDREDAFPSRRLVPRFGKRPVIGPDLIASGDRYRNDRHAGFQGDPGAAVFERPQYAGPRSGPFRMNEKTVPLLYEIDRPLRGVDRVARTLYRDASQRLHPQPRDQMVEMLCLGHTAEMVNIGTFISQCCPCE